MGKCDNIIIYYEIYNVECQLFHLQYRCTPSHAVTPQLFDCQLSSDCIILNL